MRKIAVPMTFALLAVSPFIDGSARTRMPAVQALRGDAVEQAGALWQMRRTRSAIELLQVVVDDPKSDRRAYAQLLLGDIYFFRGWESENAFPGWHEEPECRGQAVQAFRAAEAARPDWSAPHERLGRAFLREERAPDALAEFDEALKRAPGDASARIGRWRALLALGKSDAAGAEIAIAANASDPESLDAARQGLALLGRRDEADAIGARLLERFPASAAASSTLAERILAARIAKRYGDLVDLATRFIQQYPSSPALVDVFDALLDAYQSRPPAASADAREIIAAIDARTRLRADPGPMLAVANLLIARGVRLEKAIALGEASIPTAERFVQENAGAYKMADKARATFGRTRATATDLVGWAYFLDKKPGNLERAAPKLFEAERLSHGQDAANQFHLGDLARAKDDVGAARERYLACLTLTGSPQIQAAARESLADVYGRLGGSPTGFDAYLSDELARRREARHTDLVRSLVDRPAPPLKLTDLNGHVIDLTTLRGKVVLLNFFSSW